MAKNSLLYGCLLPVALCLCGLPAGPVLSQQLTFQPQGDSLAQALAHIYRSEIGVTEASGHNDGPRVAAYLRYTNLPEGYAWCAAFVSWCFGRLGYSQPRNAWSPALFPARRIIAHKGPAAPGIIRRGDVFGLYNSNSRRIDHVGFIDDNEGHWWITVEGNAQNAVRRMRRHHATIYSIARWLDH